MVATILYVKIYLYDKNVQREIGGWAIFCMNPEFQTKNRI